MDVQILNCIGLAHNCFDHQELEPSPTKLSTLHAYGVPQHHQKIPSQESQNTKPLVFTSILAGCTRERFCPACDSMGSLTLSVLAILALLSLVPVSAAACVSRRRRAVATCGFTSTSNCTCLSGTCGSRSVPHIPHCDPGCSVNCLSPPVALPGFAAMAGETSVARYAAVPTRSRFSYRGYLRNPLCAEHVGRSGLICSTWGPRELHLNGNNLTGTLPASLGTSTDLLHMYLQSNSLSGSIPQSLTTSPLATLCAQPRGRLTVTVTREITPCRAQSPRTGLASST